MRWGLIARADDRGLGNMTWEVARNLHPDRVLAVDMGQWARGFTQHRDRYPGATWVSFDAPSGYPLGDLGAIEEWLTGLDVVYTAETFYDPRLVSMARSLGVATVVHTMPEFHRPELDSADRVWLPSPWREKHHPNAMLIPVPVAADRFKYPQPDPFCEGPLRVLHVAGNRAHMDRNGTLLFVDALRYCRENIAVTIRTQNDQCPHPAGLPGNVTATVHLATQDPYWEAYRGQHVLCMPRRYGGLCLPVQEALAAGLAVVMSGCPPNDWWPTLRVAGGRGPAFHAPVGAIPSYNTDPMALAAALDRLAADRRELHSYQQRAAVWTAWHSWERLADLWTAALEDARDR